MPRARAHSRALLGIPASHISGLGAVVMAMLRAGGCIVIDGPFKPRTFLERMAAERITFTVLVPAMYKLCLLDPTFDATDLDDWRIGLFGGAVMPTATIAELARRLPGLRLINAYGATETTSPATIMPPGAIAVAPDSIGKAVPCGDILVMDESGREAARGEPGELWIGGPMIAQCYWNDETATQASFTAGYWRSGDIGSIDAQGFVRIHDRLKDMINRAGYKVYSAEVENVLALHPRVIESVVVGRPDPVLGERVHAFVRADDASLEAQTLATFCAERLADYKVPESWTISTEPLPRNANGKFEKRRLAREIAAANGG
ncbi:class I adenylate-forming enzyme family protein [Pantanalinema rosaneae CENA516]|uniref:class I adenylate-forming enzyme family protein n=1 Tax=Pantanalinema rosaneae TaxID=1620701 RepID=UPI003D7011F0